jgi:YcaO-like protein with predicted kinase domain
MAYSKYKDAPPEETIKRIKECFSKVGIDLKHKVSKRMDGIYSSVVFDDKGGWSTAGKGTTEEFCLASGYAEAMEHFCNYCAYDWKKINEESRVYLGFDRYPDETITGIEQLQDIHTYVKQEMEQAYSIEGDSCNDEDLIKTWKDFLNCNSISLVPYYSVKKRKVVELPEAIVGKLCGSTGGGAGNSPEEAIGHGLDEISERYVKYIIYSEELTPPEIPFEYIEEHCPEIFQIIQNIQKEKRYSVIVFDASLGKNYPVVAVCVIDKDSHSYVVNFGAHPCFTIALERCLTEMFQFMTLEVKKTAKHKSMEKWTSFSQDVHSVRNWVSLLRDDTGKVPDTFFAGRPSWKFRPWGFYDNYNNKYGMQLQIDNFLKNGVKDIFIRDFSFLGFPVYRIYIPELSVSHYTISKRVLKNFEDGNAVIQSIISQDKCKLSREEQKLMQQVFANDSYISTWIIRDIKESYLDLAYIFLIKDMFGEKEAMEMLSSVDEDFSAAIGEDLHMKILNKPVEYRDRLIDLFYGSFILDIVIAWRKDNCFAELCLVLKKYNFLRKAGNDDIVKNIQLIHRRFKECMLKNVPDQMRIEDIL